MPMFRPSSGLRNKYNGTGDPVVMANAQYEQLCGKSELHRLLDAGLTETRIGHGRPAPDVSSDLEERFGLSADV